LEGTITEACSKFGMGLQLRKRRLRRGQVMKIFLAMLPSVSLGDVGRNGDCRALHLSAEPIRFVFGKEPRFVIRLYGQVHAQMPNP
jgi:hypothetical protein